jgi:hypothetical protein
MTKKNIILTIGTIGIGLGVSALLYYKHKKNKKIDSDTNDIELNNDEWKETTSDDHHDSSMVYGENAFLEVDTDDDNIGHIDTVIMEDETIDTIHDEIINKFFEFLTSNGVDTFEAESICETIREIEANLPDQYMTTKYRMIEMMNSEFDLEKSQAFDKENFTTMYKSIDVCKLFLSNGFKILSMGPDYQDDMMELADRLAALIETNCDDVLDTVYDIYHIFNSISTDDITESTYEEKFKQYVDKYVNVDVAESKQNKEKKEV